MEAPTLLESIEHYYTAKVRKYGATPEGVDWISVMSQRLRFVQLLKVIDWRSAFSLHDVGCGYGALLAHLADRHADADIRYIGSDVSGEMIRRARSQWRRRKNVDFVVAPASTPVSDYCVASGIFNVKLDHARDAWERHVALTLAAMHGGSRRGFAVNFMTPGALSDRPAAAGGLYVTEPERWVDHCRSELGCEAQLVEDYGLREFTLLVKPSLDQPAEMRARSASS